jgi:hypothetical protein
VADLENCFTSVWEFVRGDMTISVFEKELYSSNQYEKYFGQTFYLEVISNDFRNSDSTFQLKQKLAEYQRKVHTTNCKCVELKNLAVLDMFHDEKYFDTFQTVLKRGQPLWWLYLSCCEKCNQYWLVAQEERHNDIYCLCRLNNIVAEKIISENIWPSIFDRFEDLLKIGLEAGKSVRFLDPLNDSSLAVTMEDVANANPGIKLSYIAKLLILDIDTAALVAKSVIAKKNVNISLNE